MSYSTWVMLGHPVREKIRNPNEERDNTEIICNFIRLNVSRGVSSTMEM